MMYGSDLGSNVISKFGRNLAGNFRNISVLIVCSVQINSAVDFLFLGKSNLVNDVPQNDDCLCLDPASRWRC